MSRPPSPISPPRSLTNGVPTPRPPPPIFPEDDCGPRSLEGGRNGHHPHHPNHPRLHHHNHHHHHNSFANFTYGSIEDEGGVTLPDPGELQQEVLELTHTNKRLTGENHDLTSHLTTAEETNAALRDQCRALQHALEGVQQQLSVARELEAEVEAARRQVEDGREEKESLVTRLAHLERDNTSLTSRLQLLTQQLSAAQEEAENHSQREEEAVKRHREEVARLSSQLSQWKAQAETQTLAAYRLRETLEDVRKLVEVLREEKKSLEEQLNHVKEELAAATASTESELSGLELGDDGMTFDTVTPEKVEGGKRSDAAAPSPVTLMPGAPFATPATATPTQAHPSPSVNTPLSIHSEIHTMGEDSGSLPFCEKSEGASSEERPSTSSSDAAGSPLASVLASMLRWWREWEERGIPLLRAMLNQDTITLHNHVATHYEELLRLERELQEIRRVTQPLSTTSEWAPLEEALQRGSVSSARDSALPSSQATTPTMPRRQVRTPGSFVSQLISKFESSSQSSSPVCSEASEVPGSGDHLSGLSRMLQRARWDRRPSFDDCARSESTNSEDGRSLEPHMKRTFEEKIRLQEDYLRGHGRDTVNHSMSAKGVRCDGHGPVCGSEGGPVSSDHSDKEGSVFLEYGLERKETSDIHSLSLTAQGQEDAREEEDEPEGRTVVMEEEPVPMSDPYMETSHLMKLMNEVAEQRGVISELRQQVSSGEEDKYKLVATLERLHHLALLTSSDTFRWTEGVRREWLAVVAPRQGRLGEDGEGTDSPTSALPAHHPLDEVPLTTSFSREEIEALISARRDPPPCDVLPREEDQAMHVASPESLAAELERELTALRVHVLRSHALLHHYQSSSSQYGSRAEVSTPATQQIPHHVQGVEVGVECDLCGPTCVPRPCDSTATQTPASPLSTTPDCEEDVGAPLTATTTASTSGTRLEAEEEEEEQQQQQQQERERVETKPQAKQKTIQWKEEYLEVEVEREEEEEEEEEGRRVKDKEEEGSTVFDEGSPFQEEHDLLLSVGGGAKEPRRPHQQPPHQQPQQRPPGPRQVGFLGLPEHRQLQQIEVIPPAHRTLRQLGVVEEDDKEAAAAAAASAAGVVEEGEIVLMASEHTLYSPKPAYDHLDHYRSGGAARGTGEEKLRRTGLSTVTPQISGASEALDKGGDAPPSPLRPRPRQQPATQQQQQQQEEEEEEEEKEKEGETNNTKKERVFPSLHDTYLRTAGLLRDDPAFTSNENLSAQEIEKKFTQLSLAFKTDRLTLRQRLDLQQRHRDTAESNLENEFKHLRSSVLALHADCMDSELVDAVTQVRRHLDVLAASSNRLISTSEVWGAVQQEWRVSRALEVLFLHVDNVKRMYEQDHKELEELRRLLKECQIELPGQGQLANGPGGNNQTSTDSPVASRRLRALSLAICSTKAAQSSETRRVSVASSSSSKSSASGFAGSARSRNRRASLMPDLKPFRELAGFTAAALTASRESSSSSSSASGLSVPKESAEEGTASSATTSGRWSCSITEEVNESGEEDAGSTHDTTSSTTSNAAATTVNNNNNTDDDDSTPGLPGLTPANIAALSHLHHDFQLEDDLLTDSEERDSDDSDHSEISQAPSEEPKPSLPTFLDRFWARSRPPPWVLVAVEGLIGWAKGGQWPYSQQQTVQGARYAFTSLLLLLAALFLLVTLSSGDASIPQPRHPGWTTMNHLLHPFVTLRYLHTPPT